MKDSFTDIFPYLCSLDYYSPNDTHCYPINWSHFLVGCIQSTLQPRHQNFNPFCCHILKSILFRSHVHLLFILRINLLAIKSCNAVIISEQYSQHMSIVLHVASMAKCIFLPRIYVVVFRQYEKNWNLWVGYTGHANSTYNRPVPQYGPVSDTLASPVTPYQRFLCHPRRYWGST